MIQSDLEVFVSDLNCVLLGVRDDPNLNPVFNSDHVRAFEDDQLDKARKHCREMKAIDKEAVKIEKRLSNR